MARQPRKSKGKALHEREWTFRAGVVLHVCCPGFHLLPATARALGVKHGNYLQVSHPEHDTCIVRELVSCNRGCPGMREDYLYMDAESAHYLLTEVHDCIEVKLAEYEMDFP